MVCERGHEVENIVYKSDSHLNAISSSPTHFVPFPVFRSIPLVSVKVSGRPIHSLEQQKPTTMQIISLLLATGAGLVAAGPLTSANDNSFSAVVEKRASFPIPASKGTVKFSSTYTIAKGLTYDGGYKTFGRGVSCTGQAEGGDSDAVFILEEGATLAK